MSSLPAASIISKKKHFRVKNQKFKFHAKEPLLSVLIWTVNHTISELNEVKIPVIILPDHFRAYSKIKVDYHLFNKENAMPSHFKVKEYCPLVFKNLRERFGVSDIDYRKSLTRSPPVQIDSSGKSGAQFYRSYDKLFMIKSLTSEEVERMHSFLKQYHPYIVERHGHTLLPQYLALYRLTVDGEQSYFVVMRNVFSSHLPVHIKFDLKGSTVDREASDKELEKTLPTLKDNDFIKNRTKITIGDDAKVKLFETLNADVNFLTKLHLMDYSLLLGIHDCNKADENPDSANEYGGGESRNVTGIAGRHENSDSEDYDSGDRYNTPPDSPRCIEQYRSIIPEIDIYAVPSLEDNHEIYFIAIIDVLTHYGVKKQAAKAAKTVKYGSNVDGISTCDPEQYAKRFIEFIDKAIA